MSIKFSHLKQEKDDGNNEKETTLNTWRDEVKDSFSLMELASLPGFFKICRFFGVFFKSLKTNQKIQL